MNVSLLTKICLDLILVLGLQKFLAGWSVVSSAPTTLTVVPSPGTV